MHTLDNPKPKKRKVEIVVISDVHLGTFGCHAQELVQYLKSIKPKHLILNGDIIDIWQFNKNYFPKAHLQVVRQLMRMVSKGVKVHYVTGNHDEMLRKFVGFEMGSLKLVNSLVLDLDGHKTWIFHGDIFDVTMKHSKWLTKLGAWGYDFLILLNSAVNFTLTRLGYEKISFSKKVKDSVKGAVKFINNFEETCAEIAIRDGYDYVVCGHIHKPEIKQIHTDKGSVNYLNSGDWVENLTALEYNDQQWTLYYHKNTSPSMPEHDEEDTQVGLSNKELFNSLLSEFQLQKSDNTEAAKPAEARIPEPAEL